MSARRRSAGALSAALLVLLAACSSSGGSTTDSLPTTDPAQPAVAPSPTPAAAGTLRPVGAVVTAAVAVPGTSLVALLTASPERVLLLDTTTSDAPRSVALPGPADGLAAGRDGHVLVAGRGAVLDVDAAAGTVSSTPAPGDATSVALLPDGRTAVGLADGSVAVLAADGSVAVDVGGIASADGLVVADGTLHVLDREQTALLQLDLGGEGSLGLGLRAGLGATTAVADRFGRVVVADTRGGQLLVFGTDPFLERQQYPVPGAPYAMAYDATRNLVWVTLTATDEVVGYELSGGQPVERYRLPTVHEPDSVAVDPTTGVVVVASGSGDGVAQVDPSGGAR